MGIALGLGIVFGVRAAEGDPSGVVPVVMLLVATAVIASRNTRNLYVVAALGALIGAGAGLHDHANDAPFLAAEPEGVIVGVIRSDMKTSESGRTAQFSWKGSDGVRHLSRVSVPAAPHVDRGDSIELAGNVYGTSGQQIVATQFRVLERAGWVELRRRAIREYLSDTIQRNVPGTPGALTLGLLIGDDTALTEAERNDLRHAGLSHLTAVSGWNVTLVTSTIGLLFLKLGLRGWRWSALQLIALAGFVWVVGLDPPVTRAAIMAVAGLVAIRLGRPTHSVTVLTLSASLMVAVTPAALTTLSFQLSVLATLGLILAARMTEGFDGWRAIALTPLVATATIGIITAPLLAAEFGTVSLMTIPANVLAAPLAPVATVAGIIVVAASPVGPLASIAGWGAWLLSALLLTLARVLAAIPFGFHEFAPLSDTVQATLYFVMLIVVTLVLPEGKLMVRAASQWMRHEPVGAALSASAACVALLTAALTV